LDINGRDVKDFAMEGWSWMCIVQALEQADKRRNKNIWKCVVRAHYNANN